MIGNWIRLYTFAGFMLACLNDPAFGQVYLTYTESKYTGSYLEDCGNNTVLHIYSSGISRISINGTFEEKELLKWVSEVKDRASAASCFDEDIIYLAGWGNLFRYSVSKDSVETLEGFQNGIISPYFARDTSDHLYLNSDRGIFRIEKQGSFRELGKIPESGYIRSFAVLDSQDILVSTSNNWLFHFVGKEVDTIGFPASNIFSDVFGGKYLVARPKKDSLLKENALLIDGTHRQGLLLDWVLEPASESELKMLLETRSVGGKKVVATYFADQEFRAVYHWDEEEQKVFAKTFQVLLGPSVQQFKVISAPLNRSGKNFILTSHGLYYLGVDTFPSSLAGPFRAPPQTIAPRYPFLFDVLGRSKPERFFVHP